MIPARYESPLRFARRALTPAHAVRGLWFDEAVASEPPLDGFGSLTGSTDADVCIIGGGFTGLWTALEIKRRSPDTDVLVLEADRCGGGASGRNGGFAMTWWSKFASLKRLCGTIDAVVLARRAEGAVGDIGAFCKEHEIDAEFRASGWVWAATNTNQINAWSATLVALEAAGVAPFARLSQTEVAERTGSPVHLAGVYEAGVATLQPAKLARGMARVALEAGVRICEGTAMTELRRGEPAHVLTTAGTVRASKVILAINAWASQIPQVGRGLVVVSSDVIATTPIPDQLDALGWRDGPAISDSRRLVNYYRTSCDGRLVFGKGGGTVAVSGRLGPEYHIDSPRAAEVAAQLRFIYPMLWQVPIEHTWRGPIDYSVTGLPFFCRLPKQPNVLVAAGFSGNGVGPAKLAGELLAEMTLEGGDAGLPPALTRAPAPRMPPEPIRYLGARMVRGALARKEAREDVGARAGRLTAAFASLDPTSFVDGESGPTLTPVVTAASLSGNGHGPQPRAPEYDGGQPAQALTNGDARGSTISRSQT